MRADMRLIEEGPAQVGLTLTMAQTRVIETIDGTTIITGPPRSGKTTALAARALGFAQCGGRPIIICSHASSSKAFADTLMLLHNRVEPPLESQLEPATLPEHVARWVCADYLRAQTAPLLAVGGSGAARAVLSRAAHAMLDMRWPLFARPDLNLDLPYLSRPESFLDEAASLFTLLQRARVTPQEFEEGCAAGLAAFYGEGAERALVLIEDRAVAERGSSRARDACRVSAEVLTAQRRAERDLAAILIQLYRDYLRGAAAEAVRSADDLIDAATRWLTSDDRGASALAQRIDALIIDDAEDAEPGLSPIIGLLQRHRAFPVFVAGWANARIDGLGGRRSALNAFASATHIEFGPLAMHPTLTVERHADETSEMDSIAAHVSDLIRGGSRHEDVAVLCRTVETAAHYARKLRERGLSVALPASLFEREQEVADLLALCAVVDDPLDEEHLLRVLASPLGGLSDHSIWTLCRDPAERRQLTLTDGPQLPLGPSSSNRGTLARNMLSGEADTALPPATRNVVQELRSRLEQWRRRCVGLSAAGRLDVIADAAGFRNRWHAAPEVERNRLYHDFERLVVGVSQAARLCGAQTFPAIARLIEDEVITLPLCPRLPGAVVVDSILAVKGLEFDHVVVAGVAHERFPRIYTSHAMAFSRTYGLIVRENVAGGASQTAKYAWYYAKFGAKALYLTEEERVLRYGLARAQKSAVASGFGTPPYWARQQDLLAMIEQTEQQTRKQT